MCAPTNPPNSAIALAAAADSTPAETLTEHAISVHRQTNVIFKNNMILLGSVIAISVKGEDLILIRVLNAQEEAAPFVVKVQKGRGPSVRIVTNWVTGFKPAMNYMDTQWAIQKQILLIKLLLIMLLTLAYPFLYSRTNLSSCCPLSIIKTSLPVPKLMM